MKYKLGSQIDVYQNNPNGSLPDIFEWNICMLDEQENVIAYVPIGKRTVFDPIVRLARELVINLNKEARTPAAVGERQGSL